MTEGLNEITRSIPNSNENLKVDTSKELDLSKKESDSIVMMDYSKELDLSKKDSIYEYEIDFSKEMDLTEIVKEYNSEINKVDKLSVLNDKLKNHLAENGIENAVIYEPHNPDAYWAKDNIRIAFCNEEPYSTDDNFEKGIKTLDSKTLDDWSDGNKTIKTEFDLNYLIRKALQNGKEVSIDDIAKLKNEIKPNGNDYFNKYEDMDKSMYFNFRYSIPTDTSHEHTGYIQEKYKNDPFYAQHYKEFLEATDPQILVVGSRFGTELLTQIYPELQGKLTYCGEPVIHNGRLIVSIPHPSRISNEGVTETVNKIVNNKDLFLKSEIPEDIDSIFSEFNRGREMTFTEADSGSVNPNLDESEGFQCNCQTCVVVFEARLRGYDIEACPFENDSNAMQLSERTNLAWITEDGQHPYYIMNLEANSVDAMYDFIDKTVKPGERYTLEGVWKGGFGIGHIFSVFRENTGNLVFYDPQVNQIYSKRFMKEELLPYMQKGNTEDTTIKLLRIDNVAINTEFIEPIVRRSENYA